MHENLHPDSDLMMFYTLFFSFNYHLFTVFLLLSFTYKTSRNLMFYQLSLFYVFYYHLN